MLKCFHGSSGTTKTSNFEIIKLKAWRKWIYGINNYMCMCIHNMLTVVIVVLGENKSNIQRQWFYPYQWEGICRWRTETKDS